jgi:spore germination cell wall hydrolase CwlJ-like protein
MSPGGILLLLAAVASHVQQVKAEQASERAERSCLTQALYYEARGEGERGEEAVAEVILHRVQSRRYPNSICGVVYEPHQFSFVDDGSRTRARDPDAWGAAKRLAGRIMHDGVEASLTRGAMFYHTVDVQPEWSASFVRTVKIGRHIFYRIPRHIVAHARVEGKSTNRSS